MIDTQKDILDGNLTQKEIIQLLLHNAQHMATRDEVKADIKELKIDLKHDIANIEARFDKVDEKIARVEARFDKVDEKIAMVETTLKQDIARVEARFDKVDEKIAKVETTLKQDIVKISDKFDKIQWLIVATLLTVVFKDYISTLLIK